jgi:hypothetical protein
VIGVVLVQEAASLLAAQFVALSGSFSFALVVSVPRVIATASVGSVAQIISVSNLSAASTASARAFIVVSVQPPFAQAAMTAVVGIMMAFSGRRLAALAINSLEAVGFPSVSFATVAVVRKFFTISIRQELLVRLTLAKSMTSFMRIAMSLASKVMRR